MNTLVVLAGILFVLMVLVGGKKEPNHLSPYL